MRLPLHQIDAFASRPFEGNPAAVMPLDAWLPDALLQSIAAENNLSETAFLVKESSGWRIRWFTPANEVDLCGHATLASAWLVLNELEPGSARVTFQSQSGVLTVDRQGEALVLDFPSRPGRPAPERVDQVAAILGCRPLEVRQARDVLAVLEDETAVRAVAPDYEAMKAIPGMGLLITAPGREHDFVSRCFFPADGIPEDPVTGSAHCTLIPYWAERLGKNRLRAFQASPRGGELTCELTGERVRIGGQAVKVLEGHFLL
ncbi:PhzF family phenazine biosynthesis protein [Geothrix sp. PMB-07]|uniref:PhzF family phenazine biosynthesis protein n=1 Tax=Geothrix sp. PMB-07 TaxID=3068640 RepID=UPI002741A495|nr:PhzF family phenazine biosynthesis protein [Geothrix sp. PMB-07]WLT30222.1 PhzF family phenazine biosynthesis protein [Geothrix sp. PMB-07]